MRGRILVVDHTTPTPDRDAGSARAFVLLRILSRAGFQIAFAPATLLDNGAYSEALRALGIRTIAAPEFASIGSVVEALAPQCDLLILSRAPVAESVFDHARRASPATKILFDTVDLYFLRMQREAAVNNDAAAMRKAQDMQTVELDLVRRADATIVVSDYEQELLQDLLPGAHVVCIPILYDIPPTRPGASADFAARRDIVFIGAYEHRPNVDAVAWFCREVWPLVLRHGLDARLIVVGSQFPAELADLASESIEIRGYVADLAAVFDSCRLSVAPLRFGAGVKGKIVSSLSYGVPVVATSIAAEGMGLRDGEEIAVADEPAAMAELIVRLYRDRGLWHLLSANGYAQFARRFSVAAGTPVVLSLVDRLIAERRSGTGAPGAE